MECEINNELWTMILRQLKHKFTGLLDYIGQLLFYYVVLPIDVVETLI